MDLDGDLDERPTTVAEDLLSTTAASTYSVIVVHIDIKDEFSFLGLDGRAVRSLCLGLQFPSS